MTTARGGEPGAWVDAWCHGLKHEPGAAVALIADLEAWGAAVGNPRRPAAVEPALTDLGNPARGGRRHAAARAAQKIRSGSGVPAAACQVRVKPRGCGSGMRGKERGAAAVLSLRCLTSTTGRGAQFWSGIARSGFPVAA